MRSLVDDLERHTNAVYWSDGLLDLLVGVAVVFIGVSWLGELVVLGAVSPALVLPLWLVLRRHLVEPRRGYVRLAAQRQRDLRRLSVGSLVAGLGALALMVLLAVVGTDAAMLVRAAPGALVGALALATGAALELRRFALYAPVLVGVGIASALVGFNPGWAFVCGGAVAAAVGLFLLLRFLRRYPNPAAGQPAEAG